MKPVFLLLGLLALPASAIAADSKSEAPSEAPKRHPLKGVVVAVDAEQSALRVKHEDIPGVMRAMTMQFKVDASTLKTVKAGDAITAQMSRAGAIWWLHDVKVVSAK